MRTEFLGRTYCLLQESFDKLLHQLPHYSLFGKVSSESRDCNRSIARVLSPCPLALYRRVSLNACGCLVIPEHIHDLSPIEGAWSRIVRKVHRTSQVSNHKPPH